MANNYRRGYTAELKAQKELEARGYLVARTAGSHGPFDIVAIREGEVLFLQVKRGKRFYPHIIEEAKVGLQAIPRKRAKIRCEVWFFEDGGLLLPEEC